MRFLTAAIIILCLAGDVVSILALREHYNLETSPCSINERWDCGAVNHSIFAVVNGVPVAAIGILGYALLGILAGRFPRLTVLGALGGLGFALRLTYIEWKVLEVWCIYCVASQGIIALISVLAVAALFVGRRTRAHA
ncbi:MAG TPA: vitamin K epoxide reductase family protein [Terriglobales bacterium]|jgi:uncharacterized membrane protein|nr:vitamin K epoxide reductase family protein [Terriglobales bacterium]